MPFRPTRLVPPAACAGLALALALCAAVPAAVAEPLAGGTAPVAPLSPVAAPATSAPEWTLDGVDAPATVLSGTPFQVAPVASGDLEGATYNYVWSWQGSWKKGEWGSTGLETGSFSAEASSEMTLTRAGTYDVYVDVLARDGEKRTAHATVEVAAPEWSFDGVDAPATVLSGTPFQVAPVASGDLEGATYNHVWSWQGSWKKGEWGSTGLETGSFSAEASSEMTLTRAGTYDVYVDVLARDGEKRTAHATVEVAAPEWSFDGLSIEGVGQAGGAYALPAGSSLTVAPKVSGDLDGITYNYVWSRNGSWKKGEWWSTALAGAYTTDESWSFSPDRIGTYTLYVDALDRAGTKRTMQATVAVTDDGWKVTKVDAPALAKVGTPVSFSAVVEGDVEGATYNYVWSRNGSWKAGEWGSTAKSSGSYTSATSGSFTFSRPGTYTVYVDVMSAWGQKRTASATVTVWGLQGVTASQSGNKITWSADLGVKAPKGLTFNYVWSFNGSWKAGDWSSTINDTGKQTTATSATLDCKTKSAGREGCYTLYVDVFDADGNKVTAQAKVLWCPSGKYGWQNPAGYYQVSSHNVRLPAAAYSTPFSYVTPSRISAGATRDQCVNAFVQRAYEYLGTPYMWNYSRQPGVGVDCIGLVFQCAYACGMDLGEFNPYDHYYSGVSGWHSHDANNMWNYGKIQRLPLGSRRRGDLIFWPGHVAIYIGNDQIIEAPSAGLSVRVANMWVYGTPRGVGRMFV